MKAIVYTRVSSDEQVKGTSLGSQEELCREYCARRGLEVAAVFREEGESAKTADRTQLLRALEFCRAHRGQVAQFVVAKLDRFARNAEDHILVRKELGTYGVTLHSVSEPIGDGPSGRFIEMVLAASSEFDNAVRRQRCTDGMAAKLRQGISPWRPPLGYVCAQNKKHGRKKTDPDAPDRTIFPIISTALKQYARGEIRSQVDFRQLLDRRGLATARGARTSKQMVDWILGRYLPFYAGILVNPWTGEEIVGLHQPMITRQEMKQIQLVRSGRGRRFTPHDRRNPLFPLRRTVLCAACGKSFTGSQSTGNGGRYAYYHCYNSSCSLRGKAIPVSQLESAFILELRRIALTEQFLALLNASVLEAWKDDMHAGGRREEELSQKLSELEARRRKIFDMREDGSYTPALFRERLALVEANIAEISLACHTRHNSHADVDVPGLLDGAAAIMLQPDDHWKALGPEKKQRFQRLVFPEGTMYDRDLGFRTGLLGLPFELNRAFHGSKSDLVHHLGRSSNILSSLQELVSTCQEMLPEAPRSAA